LETDELARPARNWLIPLPMVAMVLVQTVLGVIWLDNRLAPIDVLVEKQRDRDERIAELSRRLEMVDNECRHYDWKGKP
jgi:hypothetical protein